MRRQRGHHHDEGGRQRRHGDLYVRDAGRAPAAPPRPPARKHTTARKNGSKQPACLLLPLCRLRADAAVAPGRARRTRDEVIPYTHATALKAQREKSSLPARRRLLSPPSRRARECGEAANSAGALRRLPTAGAAAAAAARTQCIFYAQPDATHNNYDAKADLSDPVRDFLRRFHEQRAPLTIKPGQFQTSATAKEPDLPGIMGCM